MAACRGAHVGASRSVHLFHGVCCVVARAALLFTAALSFSLVLFSRLFSSSVDDSSFERKNQEKQALTLPCSLLFGFLNRNFRNVFHVFRYG
jgi:hypothetical protein